jgi:hypothetical protein
MLERRKKKNTETKGREKYYQRNWHASEEVEWLGGNGRWMIVELSERDKDRQARKKERRERIKEFGYNREYERCMTEEIPEYLGERVQKKEKWWRDLDGGTKKEKTGIGRKERKEGVECAIGREEQLSRCGMDVAKCERRRERNGEKYWMKDGWKRYGTGNERDGAQKEKCKFFLNYFLNI